MQSTSRKSISLGSWLVFVVLSFHAIATLFPLLWVLTNSFRDNNQIFTSFRIIPEKFDFSNYIAIITGTSIPRSFFNSFTTTIYSIGSLLFVILPAAFALARFKFKLASAIYYFFSIAILIPGICLLPMQYIFINDLGLLGRQYSIILLYLVGQIPVSLFLMISFMMFIPKELDESAIIDGCNIFELFTHIILPLSRNGIVTVSILSFVQIWNDYVVALVMLPKPIHKTLTMVLALARDEYSVNYGMMSAAIVFAVIPIILFYVFIKDYLIRGLSVGAVKG